MSHVDSTLNQRHFAGMCRHLWRENIFRLLFGWNVSKFVAENIFRLLHGKKSVFSARILTCIC